MTRLPTYLAVVACLIRTHGWVSRGAGALHSTADAALEYLRHTVCRKPFEQADILTALGAIAWAHSLTPCDDFEHHLKSVCTDEFVTDSTAGYAAALVKSYLWASDQVEQYPQVDFTEIVGVPGHRLTCCVEVLAVGDPKPAGVMPFAPKRVVKLVDQCFGAQLVWMASGPVPAEMVPGAELTISGKVKRHTEYRGLKQTDISHVRIEK